jgi:hypothetical protein
MSLSRRPYSARYTSKGSQGDLIPPDTLPREMITIMRDKDIIEQCNVEQLSVGKDPTKLIFTSLAHSR